MSDIDIVHFPIWESIEVIDFDNTTTSIPRTLYHIPHTNLDLFESSSRVTSDWRIM